MFHSSSFLPLETPRSRSYERGKFGRLFPALPPAKFSPEVLSHLAGSMRRVKDSTPTIDKNSMPAGYTYLGQFITHDITFDPTAITERQVDPEHLWNFRTPSLDLDCLYGNHPKANPIYYTSDEGFFPVDKSSTDLFRRQPINDRAMALIPDPRNDENKLVSQIHLLFQKLHNKLLHKLGNFDTAQKLTKWHYQWIILNDFLPRIIQEDVLKSIFDIKFPMVNKRLHYDWRNEPFIPLEFAAAAFRFGHSVVRDRYEIFIDENKRRVLGTLVDPKELDPTISDQPRSLRGGEVNDLPINLSLFFGKGAQKSHLIQPKISSALYDIPFFQGQDRPIFAQTPNGSSLPFITMTRGVRMELPSGENVARALGLDPMPFELGKIKGMPEVSETPLWYYILNEAEEHSKLEDKPNTLGPVGSTIVGEVLIGLLQGDKTSYINQYPEWAPEWSEDFDMAKLIQMVNE